MTLFILYYFGRYYNIIKSVSAKLKVYAALDSAADGTGFLYNIYVGRPGERTNANVTTIDRFRDFFSFK